MLGGLDDAAFQDGLVFDRVVASQSYDLCGPDPMNC
jgi:hypothetical protein